MPETWEQQLARLERFSKASTERPMLAAAIRAALARLESHAELVEAGWALLERCIKWGYDDVQHPEAWTPDGDEVLVNARAVLLKARAALAHAAPQEPVKSPLGHEYEVCNVPDCGVCGSCQHADSEGRRCGAPPSAHAAPSVGEVK